MTAPRNRLLIGDAAEQLATLPESYIDMVLTSPPYYRLRNYGVSGQLGLEPTVTDWVNGLQAVSRQLSRVLVPTGSLWLNLGDSYATHARQGVTRKSLLLGPERVALALVADGWTLRNKIIWRKANPMPTSVRDRLACTWEVIYVFSRQPAYFFDLDAIRLPHSSAPSEPRRERRPARGREAWRGPNSDDTSGLSALKAAGLVGHPLGKNPGDVWTIASSNYRGGHRATFPLALAERAIRAGCPERRCQACRLPWHRPLLRSSPEHAERGSLAPSCDCAAGSEPGLVLDPFIGSGTTALAARSLGRGWLGIELSPDFAREAAARVATGHDPPQAS